MKNMTAAMQGLNRFIYTLSEDKMIITIAVFNREAEATATGDWSYSVNLQQELKDMKGEIERFWAILNNIGSVLRLEHDLSDAVIDVVVDANVYDLIKLNYMWYDGTDQYTGISTGTTPQWVNPIGRHGFNKNPWLPQTTKSPWSQQIGSTAGDDTWYGDDPPKSMMPRVVSPDSEDLPGIWKSVFRFRIKSR